MSRKPKKRRTVLKTLGAGATVAGASAITGAAEDDPRIKPEEATLPFPDTKYIDIGDDVYDAVGPDWWLLTLDRDRIDELLQMSPAAEDAIQTHSERVDALRDTHAVEQSDVESTHAGKRHTYHLVDGQVSTLDRERRINVHETANTVIEGFRNETVDDPRSERGNDVSTDWGGAVHWKQSKKMLDEFSVYYDDVVRKNSDDPDVFGCEECSVDWIFGDQLPNYVKSALEQAIRDLGKDSDAKHPPYHFYWGDLPDIDLGPFNLVSAQVGGAPGEAEYAVDQANSSYGSTDDAYLGHASHYLQDMSVPLHAGAMYAQVNPSPFQLELNPRFELHYAYEEQIAEEVETAIWADYPFVEDFQNGDPYFVFGVNNACKEMADFAGEYGPDIFDAVMGAKDRPWQWDNDGRSVYEKTHNCMEKLGGYYRGFLKEHYDYNG